MSNESGKSGEAEPLMSAEGGQQQPHPNDPKKAEESPLEAALQKSWLGQFWTFLRNKHSLLSLFHKHIEDEEWPREARIFMFVFNIFLNLFFLLKFLPWWSFIVKLIIVLACCLPIKSFVQWSVRKFGYQHSDPAKRVTRARVAMVIWSALLVAGCIWQFIKQESGTGGEATWEFFVTWGTSMCVEVVIWFVLFQFVATCCPCCLPCCLSQKEADDRKANKKPVVVTVNTTGKDADGHKTNEATTITIKSEETKA